MIYVYTGEGKGKTSACLGQAVRALGGGFRVGFAQFIKADDKAGEQAFLREHLGDKFLAGGLGFFLDDQDKPRHRAAAKATLDWAYERLPGLDVLILDEILYALGLDLLDLEDLRTVFRQARRNDCHLIVSGRGFPQELVEEVDLITEMREIKHPWQAGQQATAGLDF